MDGKYATLMETSGEDFESHYEFIRYEGNEEALKHLNEQLDQVEMELIDDLSIFFLELEYLVSAQTAKEMTKIDMNAGGFHRKFDGKLKPITFKFKKKDSNDRKVEKIYDLLGQGGIDQFVDDEDIDTSDLTDNPDFSDSFSDSYSDQSESEDDDDHRERKNTTRNVPSALLSDRPRFAKKAQRHHRG